jgi:hypothetical protein
MERLGEKILISMAIRQRHKVFKRLQHLGKGIEIDGPIRGMKPERISSGDYIYIGPDAF